MIVVYNHFRATGFTLIELLIVLAVAAILTSIALPSFQAITNTQRIKTASYEIFSSLILARSEATKANSDVTITPKAGGWQDGWQITNTSGTVIQDHPPLSGVVVNSAPANLIYKRNGRIAGTASPKFQLSISGSTAYVRCVSVSLSGLPRTTTQVCP